MLKKLFIQEWKSSWKLESIFCAVVLVLTVVGGILFSGKNVSKLMQNNNPWAGFIVSYFLLFWFTIMGFILATEIYFLFRFYKNLYTDEGYLMHTLPVKTSELIGSKALVMLLWQFIAGGVVIFAGFILLGSFVTSIDSEYSSIWSLWGEVFSSFWENFPWHELNGWTVGVFILVLFIILGVVLFNIFFGYTAISLGQFSGKHKILASIGIYIGMKTILQTVFSIFQFAFIGYLDRLNIGEVKDSVIFAIVLLCTILLYAAFSGLYAVCHYIMKNKLNLD